MTHNPPFYVALWGLAQGDTHPRWIVTSDHGSLEEAVSVAQQFPNAMVLVRPPSLIAPNGAILGKVLWKKDQDGEGYATTHQ